VLRGADVSGWFALGERPSFWLRLSSDEIRVGPEVLAQVPLGSRIRELFDPAGPVAGSVVVSRTAESGSVECSARIELKGARTLTRYFPAPIESATGTLDIMGDKVVFSNLSGVIEPESLGLSGSDLLPVRVRVDGVYRMSSEQVNVHIEASDIVLCRKAVEAIPAAGSRLWESLRPSAGKVHLSLRVDAPGKGRAERYAATARLSAADLSPVWIPLPLQQVEGTVEVSPDSIRFWNLTGVIPQQGPPAHVCLNGSMDTHGDSAELQVDLHNLQADQRVVRWIPDVGNDLWEMLGPEGVVDGTVLLRGALAEGRPEVSGTLRISSGSTRPSSAARGTGEAEGAAAAGTARTWIPVPLRQVEGMLDVAPDAVRFHNLTGVIQQEGVPGRLNLNGSLGLRSHLAELTVELHNLHATEQIVRWTPGAGEDLWELLSPEGFVDGTLLLRGDVARAGPDVSGTLQISSGRARPSFFPIPVADVAGSVRLDGPRVRIAELSGRLQPEDGAASSAPQGAGSVTVRGWLDLSRKEGSFDVRVPDLDLCQEMVEAIPGLGENLWRELKPSGMVALSSNVHYRGEQEPTFSYSVGVDLKNASALWVSVPVRLQSLNGHVVLTNELISAPSVGGRAAMGWFNASVVADLDPAHGNVHYRGWVELRRADLKSLLEELGEPGGDVQGRLSGLVEIECRHGEQEKLTGTGKLELTDGSLWSTPFFMHLVELLHLTIPGTGGTFDTGEARFELDDRQVNVKSFRVTSTALELEGYGEISLPGGELDLSMVAATPSEGGLPFVGKYLRAIIRPVERELVKLHVTGTLRQPKFEHKVLGPVTRPITSLFELLVSPFGGSSQEGE